MQQEYASFGIGTGLCVGLPSVAYQNEALTLRPCNVPGVTVFIVDTRDSPTTAAAGYFPIVNASTTDFSRPFAMDLPQDEVASAHQTLQIRIRHLQFLTDEKTLRDRQLWGFHSGVLNQQRPTSRDHPECCVAPPRPERRHSWLASGAPSDQRTD
ncbi:MAG TPA: hypothetical protein VFL67_15570 [Mycobacterium sp.]|nr:hypothetical protein [Mycobacterium sp.]